MLVLEGDVATVLSSHWYLNLIAKLSEFSSMQKLRKDGDNQLFKLYGFVAHKLYGSW